MFPHFNVARSHEELAVSRRIDIDPESDTLHLKFEYDEDLNARVKAALPGCHWNGDAWCVSFEHVERVFDLLLNEHHFTVTPALRAYCEDRNRPVDEIVGGNEDEDDLDGEYLPVPSDTLSIRELNLRAQSALSDAFDDGLWIVGELQNFDKNAEEGHAFFELVERPDEESDPIAKIQAILFEQHRKSIRRALEEAPDDIELRDGLAVRMRGDVDLYPQRGSYQFLVDAIDPAYTTGRLQQRRRAILEHLDSEGMLEDNRKLDWPICPLRVGLITSHDSDADNDFRDELRASGYGFEVTVCDAYMQGERTEASVIQALEFFEQRAESFDVVAIVRGGGSRSDLAYFDTKSIGEAVCRHPVKIVCGIGHQRDVCLLDHVADSQKTPTAAGRALVERVGDFRDRIEEVGDDVIDRARSHLDSADDRLRHLSLKLQNRTEHQLHRRDRQLSQMRSAVARAAQSHVEGAARRIETRRRRLLQASRDHLERRRQPLQWAKRQLSPRRLKRRLERESRHVERLRTRLDRESRAMLERWKQTLESHAERLRLLDPQRILERGFAIVRRDGGVVRSVDELGAGDRLEIRLADGDIDVTVEARQLELTGDFD